MIRVLKVDTDCPRTKLAGEPWVHKNVMFYKAGDTCSGSKALKGNCMCIGRAMWKTWRVYVKGFQMRS